MDTDVRGASTVVATVLLVAVVVVISGTVGVTVLGFSERLTDPAPQVGQVSGEFVRQDGFDGGIVRLEHVAGDSIPVSQLEIAVDAECDRGRTQSRLVNLPIDGRYVSTTTEIEGADIFDRDTAREGWAESVLVEDTVYASGDAIVFRIAKSKCFVQSGSTVRVRVVHSPTNSVIIDTRLTG